MKTLKTLSEALTGENPTPMPQATNLSIVGNTYSFKIAVGANKNGTRVYLCNVETYDPSKVSLKMKVIATPGTIVTGKISDMEPVPEVATSAGKNHLFIITTGNGITGKKTCDSEPVRIEVDISPELARELECSRLKLIDENKDSHIKLLELTLQNMQKQLQKKRDLRVAFVSIFITPLGHLKKKVTERIKKIRLEKTSKSAKPAGLDKSAVDTKVPAAEEELKTENKSTADAKASSVEQQPTKERVMKATTKVYLWWTGVVLGTILLIASMAYGIEKNRSGIKGLFLHHSSPPIATAGGANVLPVATTLATTTNAVASATASVWNTNTATVNQAVWSGSVIVSGTNNTVTVNGPRNGTRNWTPNPIGMVVTNTLKVIESVYFYTNTIILTPPPAPPKPATYGKEGDNKFNDLFYHQDFFGNYQGY